MVSTLNWVLLAQAESATEAANSGRLTTIDWIVIAIYFAIIAGVAVFASRGQNTASDFFLGSRNIGWFAIGGSLFASNIGSEHIVGLAGSGANTGLSMAHWELHAWVLLMLGWVFVPYYYRSKVFTMPEFLERRFNSTARWILSIISLSAYVLTKVSVTVYAGALVFKALLPDTFNFLPDALGSGPDKAFWAGAILTVILTGLYSVSGGLRAVLYTDACQAIILLLGSIFILGLGMHKLSDGQGIAAGWTEMTNYAATSTKYALWHPLSDPEFPWLAICIASPIIGIWYWCTDQYIVQRTLAARNLETARRGTIWGAALKVMPVMIFLIPGLVGAAINAKMYKETGTMWIDVDPAGGKLNNDGVFPILVTRLLPQGLRGLVVAGLLAALMSSLSSLFNSSASLFTIDIYQKLKKTASQKELVFIGKIATTVVVILGLIWIPIIKEVASKNSGLYDYLQQVQSFLAPAITATFLLGIFWSRMNAKGAVSGLLIGFVLGMGKLTIQSFYGADKISNPEFLAKIGDYNPYYACGVLFVICAVIAIVVSLASKAPDAKQIEGLTFSSINKEEVRASIHPVDIVTTLIVVGMILTVYLYFSFWTVGKDNTKQSIPLFSKYKVEENSNEIGISFRDYGSGIMLKDLAEIEFPETYKRVNAEDCGFEGFEILTVESVTEIDEAGKQTVKVKDVWVPADKIELTFAKALEAKSLTAKGKADKAAEAQKKADEQKERNEFDALVISSAKVEKPLGIRYCGARLASFEIKKQVTETVTEKDENGNDVTKEVTKEVVEKIDRRLPGNLYSVDGIPAYPFEYKDKKAYETAKADLEAAAKKAGAPAVAAPAGEGEQQQPTAPAANNDESKQQPDA